MVEPSVKDAVAAALKRFAARCEEYGARLDAKAADWQVRIDRWEERMNAKIDSWGKQKGCRVVKLLLVSAALSGSCGCDQEENWKAEAVSTPQIPLLTERIQFNEIRSAFEKEDDSPEAYMRTVVPRPILCNELAPQQEKVEGAQRVRPE